MPDLDTRFGSFGRVHAPELWSEIERREPSLPPGPPLRPRIVAAVVALLVAAAGFAFAERAFSGDGHASHQAMSAPAPGRIAFSAYEGGSTSWDIFSMNADGSDVRDLTDSPVDDSSPRWSPDGTQIAFDSELPTRHGQGVYVMNSDGTDPRLLAPHGANASWSPGGTQIAYVSSSGEDYEISVINADGTGETDLSNEPHSWDLSPSWSPDGSRIAFASVRGNSPGPQIYVMNADGSQVEQLTDSPNQYSNPAWSPDGSQIAFASMEHGVWGVDVMAADGTNPRRLADTPGGSPSPSWSPDGSQIAYETGFVNTDFAELNVVNADGSGAHAITDHQFRDLCCASWGVRNVPETAQPPLAVPHDKPLASPLPVRDPVATAAVKVSDFPKEVPNTPAAGFGSVWTGIQRESGADFVARIDTTADEVVARIPVNEAPWDIAAGAGSVWVTTYGDSGGSTSPGIVQRIDPATNAVIATVQVDSSGHPGAIAASDQAVWVDIGDPQDRRLVRIDPSTNAVVQTLSLPGPSNAYVAAMQEVSGDLWVSRSRGADLLHVDAATGEIVGSIPRETLALAGPDGMWVRGPDGAGGANSGFLLRRLDPATDRVVGDPIHIPDGYGALAADRSGVWLDGYDPQERVEILHVDAASGEIDARSKPIDSYYTGGMFDSSTGSFWVTAPLGSLTRFDIP